MIDSWRQFMCVWVCERGVRKIKVSVLVTKSIFSLDILQQEPTFTVLSMLLGREQHAGCLRTRLRIWAPNPLFYPSQFLSEKKRIRRSEKLFFLLYSLLSIKNSQTSMSDRNFSELTALWKTWLWLAEFSVTNIFTCHKTVHGLG